MDDKYLSNGTFTIPYVKVCEGEEKYKQCAHFIKKSKNITIITGAGLSTYSNIPDFRSAGGLYSLVPERFFSIEGFEENPEKFYRLIQKTFSGKKPNKAHMILSEIERTYKEKNINIITQNIESLHSQSGSKNVIQVHGTIKDGYCLNCGREIRKLNLDRYRCNCISNFSENACSVTNGLIRPNIVFYGEDIKHKDECIELLRNTDLLIIIGTSLTVEPVASFPSYLNASTPIIIINKEKTHLDDDRMGISFQNDIIETLTNIREYM